MAIRGRKPKPTYLRVIEGNPGHRPLPKDEPEVVGGIAKPKKLNKRASRLWDEFIARAFWLTWADGPKAMVWVCLQAEFEAAPAKMVASRISQLRALGSELGMDPASRSRLGAKGDDGKSNDPAAKYLD